MVVSLGQTSRYDYSAGVCFEEADGGFTDAQAWFHREHRAQADRFREISQRSEYFNAKTNGIIRKIADSVSEATNQRKKFEQGLRQADLDLHKFQQALQQGDWNQGYALLKKMKLQLERVNGFWRNYIDATSEGAQSVVRGLRGVRNTSAAFVATGGGALLLGAGMIMAGALATSAGVHAGIFSLSFKEKEFPEPLEIIALEVVDLDGEEGNQSSSLDSQDTNSMGLWPEEAKPVLSGTAFRRRPKNSREMAMKEPPKKEEGAEAFSLRMRKEEDVDLYPSQKTLEEIIDLDLRLQLENSGAVVQDATGAYQGYADGATLVRNPELGLNSVTNDAKVDDQITVDKYGNVYGVEEEMGAKGRRNKLLSQVDVDLLTRNALKISSLCNLYEESALAPGFFSTLNVFLDSSGSMGVNFYVAPATTCAYQASLSALNAKATVRVFNFSELAHSTGITRSKWQIARMIALYEGSDTLLPTVQLEPLAAEKARNDIIIVSDGHIPNYEKALPYFWDLLKINPRNRGYFVVIGKEKGGDDLRDKCVEGFKNIGFKIMYHG